MKINKYTGKIPDHQNKGGRPLIGNGLNKDEKERLIFETKVNKQISIRCSGLDKQLFLEKYTSFLKEFKYNKSQYSISQYVLGIVFNKDLNKIYKDNNLSKVSFDINKIGVNINQITKKINSFKHLNSNILEKELKIINEKLNEIYSFLDKI
jgi:hypothetical protein